jgi:hypothetical protein
MRTAYTPMTKIPITDPVDIGKVVPMACLEALTMGEIARAILDVSGRQMRTEFVSEKEFQEEGH